MTSSRFNLRMAMAAPALLLGLGLALPAARAQSTIYRCEKDGRVLYTDIKGGNCKVVDTGNAGAISTPPAGPRPSSAPIPQGAPRPVAASPANFPRVDSVTQRARDDDRREILEDELNAEQKKLADLKRDFNNGEPERQGNEKNYAKYQERVASMRDAIGRSEKNIEALKREIANIR